jgi:hypothetical protein
MRTFTITRTAFAWSELSEAAKDHAREAHSRFLWDSGDAQESMELIFDGIMEERGWADAELRTYSLYSQGGYPTWRGTLPSFTHEGRVYPLTVTTRHSGGGSEHMVCDVEDPETDEDEVYGTPAWNGFVARLTSAREAAESMVSDLSSALLYAFRAEDDYQTSEEVMAETAEANGYEYDEDGDLI